VPPITATDEDCLSLNVFTPAAPTVPGLLPVLVWVHGGSWLQGGANEQRLNASWMVALAPRVVVVTINYRLGVLGFLGSPQLQNRSETGTTGNYGLLDQRAALAWVRQNIAAFNGDADRVFLVGESAGAGSVSAHLVMPASWGLFARAGMESGAFSPWTYQSLATAGAAFTQVMAAAHCASVACLEAAPVDTLVSAFAAAGVEARPTIDFVEILAPLPELAAAGRVAPGVAVLAGSNLDDAVGVSLPAFNSNQADFEQWAETELHASPDVIAEVGVFVHFDF
jgi:para-nitrobenzyl esterase